MTDLAPVDNDITIPELVHNPYAIYRQLRVETPVLRVGSINRTLLTKARDTRQVKDNPKIFSSDDPDTPMETAFQAHTLMRKDGAEHLRERNAMAPTFAAKQIRDHWSDVYTEIAKDFVARLPRGEIVDLFPALAGPYAARCLGHLMGISDASDTDLQRWSQTLIDGAGNFGWQKSLFDLCDTANREIDDCVAQALPGHRKHPNPSALSIMLNAEDPIPFSQIRANLKITIGGGINEPRDALLTILYGLLTNPNQCSETQRDGLWNAAFEEGVRWVAPIQVGSRYVTKDTEIGGYLIPKGDTVMTALASANHDEEFWEDPQLFNIWRPKTPHQAFGNGPHFCQGTHIARRMLAHIMLPMLFDRFPNMSLPDPAGVEFNGFAFRGPLNLPVLLT